MANETEIRYGTQSTPISLGANLTNGSVAGGTTEFTNTANYPLATATLEVTTFSAAPNANATVGLYMVRSNTDGAADDTSTPGGTSTEAAEFVGAFGIHDNQELQRMTINISLTGVKAANFYIKNNTGVTMTNPITVKLLPFTYAPA